MISEPGVGNKWPLYIDSISERPVVTEKLLFAQEDKFERTSQTSQSFLIIFSLLLMVLPRLSLLVMTNAKI